MVKRGQKGDLMRGIPANGVAVAMVSHILPQVVALADHSVIMPHGRKVADQPRGPTDMEGQVRQIAGAT